MDMSKNANDARIARFWERYISVLRLFRVPERSHPWYRKHVQSFIDHSAGIRLQSQTEENLRCWLDKLSQQPNLRDWQLRQRVDALRLLFVGLLKLPWAQTFDWEYWMAPTRHLGSDHPTLAQTYAMVDRDVASKHHELAREHPDHYRKFLTMIRMADYSVNTEQAYLG